MGTHGSLGSMWFQQLRRAPWKTPRSRPDPGDGKCWAGITKGMAGQGTAELRVNTSTSEEASRTVSKNKGLSGNDPSVHRLMNEQAKCETHPRGSAPEPQKEGKHPYTPRRGRASKTRCSVNEVGHERPRAVDFHLCEMPRRGKSIETGRRLVISKGWKGWEEVGTDC